VNYISRKERPNELNYFTWKDVNNHMIESHHLIINTTPIGMYPNNSEKIIFPYEFINSNHLIIDLIYNPSKTFFLLKCEEKKCSNS
jgi:shikimate dehydrogenase